ncbi:hypothetical protein PJ311_02260 [Bacillus sp. CLL-7-23]|uniref:Uncharacterized protein n=1 Tax=Bacillus changyiensis TaxID=3004103 RepID=A0ABT4WZR0_9BACI|nr:hypothetical protein [Bacillus changyiensis]MDA7025433.1 hypothetical protein [Bacillus changyiensis]
MNYFRLKEIYLNNSGLHVKRRQPLMFCFLSDKFKKYEIDVCHAEGILFRYETDDRMEIYEFQLTFKERKLVFRLLAWDGGSYVRIYSSQWLTSPVFSQFLKNTYLSNKKGMMFMIYGDKNGNCKE